MLSNDVESSTLAFRFDEIEKKIVPFIIGRYLKQAQLRSRRVKCVAQLYEWQAYRDLIQGEVRRAQLRSRRAKLYGKGKW